MRVSFPVTLLDTLTDLERQPRARRYSDEEYNLDGFRRWLAAQDSPQQATPWLHVAGTKGKGSTCAMAESLLRAHGLRTGLFTSPHLEHYGERFRLGGHAWTFPEFEAALARIEPWLDRREPHPSVDKTWLRTVFEVLTAMCFREFAAAGVEAGVLEVGLGGRLDCTNVVDPVVCAITPIGMDHLHVLGSTIEEIAREKAGIIKPGVPVAVFTPWDERRRAAWEAIASVARERDAPLLEPCAFRILESQPRSQKVRLFIADDAVDVELPLAGDHQAANLALAVGAASEFLARRGRALDPAAVAAGVASVSWPGRLEIHSGPPALVVDAAHCPLSAAALGRNLPALAAEAPGPFVLLWGMNRDKDRAAFLRALLEAAPSGAIAYCVCFPLAGGRGATAEELAATAREQGLAVEIAASPQDAVTRGMAVAGSNASLLATGSLYALVPMTRRHHELLG
ncbi:MAG: dihydrofolate synthase / folylpolyglutamate synthase [Candidatus Sumerlaeota bacterium]|nr:dihydrofolate synthase / folylpolyglutamate synthase [Candidatus Sumerlaeota bacterium]